MKLALAQPLSVQVAESVPVELVSEQMDLVLG
jgi:hypothetical protein